MQSVSIPSSWVRITGRMDAQAHLALYQAVQERGINPSDNDAVAKVWQELVALAQWQVDELARQVKIDAETAKLRRRTIEKLTNTYGVTPQCVRRNHGKAEPLD
jgi:hypothetical protein